MNRGFSLVELIVVMGIVAVMASVAISSFQGSSKKQKQSAAFAEFKQVLQLAKSNATSGKKADTCTDPLLGWRVRFTGSTYAIEGICDTDYPTAPVTTFLTRNEILPAGVSISVVPVTVTEIVFRTLGQGAATNRFPTIVPSVQITVTDGTNTNTVTVTNRGDVDEN